MTKKKTVCMSNMKQIGLGLQLYLVDSDDQMFFRGGSVNSRSGDIPTTNVTNRWWNLLMPYVKNSNIFQCPSDALPTPSKDINGNLTILRSYIAISPAESLNLTALPDPTDTVVITEKWGQDAREPSLTRGSSRTTEISLSTPWTRPEPIRPPIAMPNK